MKIVLLTHYFPPIGGPGTRRMLGWVNGFLAAGHQVTVVTPEAEPCDPYYQADEKYVGVAKVITPKIFDPARLARGSEENDSAKAIDVKPIERKAHAKSEKRGMAARLRPWLLLPDQRRLANGPLIKAAINEIAIESPKEGTPQHAIVPTLVLTSSPYSSIHLAGQSLKKKFGSHITWIADFRDDWFHPIFFPHPNAMYRAYNRRLERSVLQTADGLSVVSAKTLVNIRARHQASFEESFWQDDGPAKWRWIPNGFDPTGVEEILNAPVPQRASAEPIKLLFSGTLWQNHSLVALVAALDEIAAETGQVFEFEIAGRVIETIPEPADSSRVKISLAGWKPYEESLAATRQADLLLVHTGPESQDIKIKVFDSAAVRRPMLVLGPEDSATVRLVQQNVAEPLIADQSDQSTIVAALKTYMASTDVSQHAFSELPDEYNRLVQAERLLEWALSIEQETSE